MSQQILKSAWSSPRSGWQKAGVEGFSPLPTGTRVGELVIQSVLGAGEFGITYVTEHEKRSKRYALKEYFPRTIASRDGRGISSRPETASAFKWGLERFLSEARGQQEVKHPSIASVLGVTRAGGTGFVGMAYEQGVDFGIWLHERKRLAAQDDLDPLLRPLLEGLSAAHAQKVFHFDITPDCLIVRESGEPVLVDFGVYRVGLRRRVPGTDLRQLSYAAPELLAQSGGPIGPWTDVYSLAGLLYLAVSGSPPASAVERANGTSFEPAVSAAKGKYRTEFLQAIDWGLKLSPIQRPRTIQDWSKALQRPATMRFGMSLWPAKAAKSPIRETANSSAPVALGAPREEPVALGGSPVEIEPPKQVETAAPLMPEEHIRAWSLSTISAIGLAAGGGVGAAVGWAASNLLAPECTFGGCQPQLMLPFTLIGAAIGLWQAWRYVRGREERQRERSEADI